MADNQTTLFDGDGDDPDWIELYNSGSAAVSLAGYCLTDDSADPGKWVFPGISLGAGEFLVVFASGKDRAIAGGELHTNFSLAAGGEYLALVGPDRTTILQEFAPRFSRHQPDESFGLPFDGVPLVASGAAARIRIPASGSSGVGWAAAGFDDSGWQDGSIGVGFGLSVPGFTIEEARSGGGQIGNLASADQLLNGTGVASETTAVLPVVNFLDTGGDGRFGANLTFPNGGGDDFAVRATGTVAIPVAGTWTFGTNSDDGVRVRVDGTNVINDDTLHAAQDRFGSRFLSAGAHAIELVFFERGGGAEVELFAAQGDFSGFNNAFRLVGDTAAGGLAVTTSPQGGAAGPVATDLAGVMRGVRGSAYVRIPFTVAGAGGLESLSLSMRYNDGFVAYLNGVEFARRNAPASPAWNSVATGSRGIEASLVAEGFNASGGLAALVDGVNVLAIHGLNVSADDDTFLLAPELTGGGLVPGSEVYFVTPTPGAVNSGPASLGRVLDPEVAPGRGFYAGSQTVTITSGTPAAVIRYTTDGSVPTGSNGRVYSDPLVIDKTTVLRVAAFRSGFEASTVRTHSYVFLDDVVQQSESPPPGWPATSVNGQEFNYGMDPTIVAGNATAIKEALAAIPSFSIVLDQDDLTGSATGIYTHAGNRGFAWERPASVELLNDPGGGFQADAGLRIRGGFSRSGGNPKHALRLFFRADYGDAKLRYPLFGDEGAASFDNIDLRTSQNYSWAFQGSGSNTFLREVFARDTQRDMGQPYTRSRYCHVYLNGHYWGLYMTQERAEASYGESYLGGDRFDYDVVKSAGSSGGYQTEATDGTMASGSPWRQLWDKAREVGTTNASNANYFGLQGLAADGITPTGEPALLDVGNLVDYMLSVYYTGGYDAPLSTFLNNASNNWFGMRNAAGDRGFVFFMHDNEHSLGTGGNSDNRVGSGGAITPWKDVYGSAGDYNRSNPQYLHEDLASNAEYRMEFADRAHEILFNGGVLTRDAVMARIEQRRAIVEQVILAEAARWGDSKRSAPFSTPDWQGAVNDLYNFVDRGTDGGGAGPGRVAVLISQLRGFAGGSKALYPPVDAPAFSQHGGYVSSGTELSMTGGSILFTVDGKDPRQVGGGTYSGSASYQGASTTVPLIGSGASWRYLDNGSNQGTAWRGTGFNDAGWPSGNAQFGYGDGDETTVVGFGADSGNKFITTYFRKAFEVSGAAQVTGLSLELLRDDGAVVFINGTEVARSNMPAGTIAFTTTSEGVAGGDDETTFFVYDVAPAVLVEGTNVIAVEVHQTSGSSSDVSFDLRLAATRTVATEPLTLPGPGEVRLLARSKAGSTWSALNHALFFVDMDPPSSANLVVSEIHYHPGAPSSAEIAAGFIDADDFEFIELTNIGTRMVNLRDARFAGGIVFDFNSGEITSLAPGKQVLLVKNRDAFALRYGAGLPVAGEFSGNLANGGEALRLEDAAGGAIRDFAYDDLPPWPVSADGLGFSLVLNSPGEGPAHAEPASWSASFAVGGNPGVMQTGPGPVLPVLVNEVLAHTDFPQVDAIELYNPNGVPVDLGGWFLSDDPGNPGKYRIPAGTSIGAGGYLVMLEDDDDNPDNNASLPPQYFGGAFSLSALGDDAWLFSGDGAGGLTGFSHGFSFRASANGVSFGRWLDSQGDESFPAQEQLTLGQPNSAPAAPVLMINEIMYHPAAGGTEFVEVWNRSGAVLPLYDPQHPENTWGVSGIDFAFPPGQSLAADELALIVADAPENFRAVHGLAPGVKIYGPFAGSLDNAGERLSLRRPDGPTVDGAGGTVVPMIDVDSVRFSDAAPWPAGPDGGGPSLERIHLDGHSNDPVNWIASMETGGTPGVLRGLLPLSLAVQGQGTVNADPDQANFPEGAVVELTPVPGPGWDFARWEGDASGSEVPLAITMTSARSVTAVFRPRYKVTAGAAAAGTGSVTLLPALADYSAGEIVTLEAVPAAGYRFVEWIGDLAGTANPAVLTMDSDQSVTARFVRQFTLALAAGAGGSVTASPPQELYDEGAEVTITAVPQPGFLFAGWGGDAQGAANPLELTMSGNRSLSAAFVPLVSLATSVNGGGSILQSPAGTQFTAGTAIELTAVPQPGWVFAGWSGHLSGTASPQSLTLETSAVVEATFLPLFAVQTAIQEGEGTIALTPSGSVFVSGTVVEVLAVPGDGHRFDRWGGSLSGNANPATLAVDGDASVTAVFVRQWKLTIGAAAGGSVEQSPSADRHDQGARVVLSAVAQDGFIFAGWEGDAGGMLNPLTVTMDADKTLSPKFVRVYQVAAVANGGGTVTVDPELDQYPSGTVVTFTATAAQGWRFSRWEGAISGASAQVTETVSGDIAAEALFERVFSVDAGVSGGGGGSVVLDPPGGVYLERSTVTVTAVAEAGFRFTGWSGSTAGLENPLSITMDADQSIIANFESEATPYQEWLADHFSPQELEDDALTAGNADADGDGFGNAIEFGMGTDPRLRSAIPQWDVAAGNDGSITMTFERPAAITGIQWVLEVSADNRNWNYNGDETGNLYAREMEAVPVGDNRERVTLQALPDDQGGTERFVRLRAVLLE